MIEQRCQEDRKNGVKEKSREKEIVGQKEPHMQPFWVAPGRTPEASEALKHRPPWTESLQLGRQDRTEQVRDACRQEQTEARRSV